MRNLRFTLALCQASAPCLALAPFVTLSLPIPLAMPARAQMPEVAPAPEDAPGELLERGAESFLRGLLKEVQPHIDELSKMVNDLQPVMREMAQMVDDIRNYDKPRLLPNGDILIPRRPGAPTSPLLKDRPEDAPADLPEPDASGGIDL